METEYFEASSISPVGNSIEEVSYKSIPYVSNYYSLLELNCQESSSLFIDMKLKHNNLKLENEVLLKKYFESKKTMGLVNVRRGSVISTTIDDNPSDKDMAKRFLLNPNLPINNSKFYDEQHTHIQADMISMKSTTSYMSYYNRIQSINLPDMDIMNRLTLWVPSYHKDFRDILLYNRRDEVYNSESKTSPLFIDGEDYVPKVYDIYSGSSMIPSTFSDFKLPALVYHCSVCIDDEIFILGGLFPSYRYDEEAPDLTDFEVDGIPNLPPPLLPQVVNNPSMLSNPFIYVVNSSTSHVRRPHISGVPPPPLLGMTGSKLTERYLFFYGGLEIKTTTKYLESSHKYIIRKRAFLNNMGYILDTLTYKFKRIDLVVQSQKCSQYSTFLARFGHLQVSIDSHLNQNSSESTKNTPTASNSSLKLSKGEITNFNQQTKTHTRNSSASSVTSNCLRSRKFPDKKFGSLGLKEMSETKLGREDDTQGSRRVGTSFYTLSNDNIANTVLVFGGYSQTGDDNFHALNDFWRINIAVVAKGRNGYYNFKNTGVVRCITSCKLHNPDNESNDSDDLLCTCTEEEEEDWPSRRGFPAYYLYNDIPGFNYNNVQVDLMDNLKSNFKVSSEILKTMSMLQSFRMKQNTASATKTEQQVNDEIEVYKKQLHDQNLSQASKSQLTLILHGGSNNLDVLGDMWWFDIYNNKWRKIDTYVKVLSKDVENQQSDILVNSVNLKAVGHNMANIGEVVSIGGGLLQEDVNQFYGKKEDEKSELIKKVGGVPLGSNMFRTFNLRTQILVNRRVFFSPDDPLHEIPLIDSDSEKMKKLMTLFGNTLTHSNGTYILIGGLQSRRSEIKEIYLRGTLLHITVPEMSLAS